MQTQDHFHDPELNHVYNKLLQEVFFRLGATMDAFFRQVKNAENPGFPRVRPRHRFFARLGPHTQEECGVLQEDSLEVEVMSTSQVA
jgi:hypothetical protein